MNTNGLRLIPKGNRIVGTVIDVNRRGELELPDSQLRGLSVFVRVESVGEDVKRCVGGDIILPRAVDHCQLRDGYKRVLIVDEDVLAVVEGLDIETTNQRAAPRILVPGRMA